MFMEGERVADLVFAVNEDMVTPKNPFPPSLLGSLGGSVSAPHQPHCEHYTSQCIWREHVGL